MKWGVSLVAAGAALLVLASLQDTTLAAKIIVGGSQHWRFGFNYTNWALKTAPFCVNDTLVFKYDSPNTTIMHLHGHSVYLLRGRKRFQACRFQNATLLGNATQGGGKGLRYVLKDKKPHYFACGEGGGIHCRVGLMKFAVTPVSYSHHHSHG